MAVRDIGRLGDSDSRAAPGRRDISTQKPASALPKEKAIQANKGRNRARIAPSITSTPSGMLTRSSSPKETQVSARTVVKRSSRRSEMLNGAVGGTEKRRGHWPKARRGIAGGFSAGRTQAGG